MAIGYRCEGCNVVRAEKWVGCCPGCGGYYSIRRTSTSEGTEEGPPPRGQLVSMNDISNASQERISTGFPGIDHILGMDPVTKISGVAAKAGQAIQIYGEPGCGKSTLLLQVCQNFTRERYDVLYIAGEENLQQIKSRADRIGKFNAKMQLIEENDLDSILSALDEVQPSLAVMDSMQSVTVEDYPQGSLNGMRIAAREIYKFTQERGIGLFLIVQVNKLGTDFAGPKEIEHIVDTSLFMRLDRKGTPQETRVLECTSKNRFGPTPAMQRFKMLDAGLFEVAEPSKSEESRIIVAP